MNGAADEFYRRRFVQLIGRVRIAFSGRLRPSPIRQVVALTGRTMIKL
jgi:hypothetical protein